MIAALDVHYGDEANGGGALAACVGFEHWESAVAVHESVTKIAGVEPYEPGAFYKRELPCLLAALAEVKERDVSTVIVDGYVWLGPGRPGLGMKLFEALGSRVPVVGVAKTAFHEAPSAEVLRGQSAKPLYVTAEGISIDAAREGVQRMYGGHRVPVLLKRADALARGLAKPGEV
jgi:deoxyribonuclease V